MNLVVIGAQWGDEGKGKIVDYLASQSDIVIRFSGGANAGHTIVSEGITYKLHLVPSGIVYPGKESILGTGMVIDPEALFHELKTLEGQGVEWRGRVFISDRAHLVLPSYKQIDQDMEKKRRNPIGTTGRGIGVAYAQKSHREGLRFADILDPVYHEHLTEDEKKFLAPFMDDLRSMAIDLASYVAGNKSRHILFEGAQGALLDLDIGTYPFVSSGYSQAAGAAMGGGIGPRSIDRVLGVFKAYTTRVGNGPFPSEFKKNRDGNLEETIRELGREYGVTTGRPRRCGYLDLAALRYAYRTNSIDSLVLTHLDVYDDMDEIKACVAYRIDGKEVTDFPSSITALEQAEPVLKSFKGWKTSISKAKEFAELPKEAKDYVRFIEEYVGTGIDVVSVGYERNQTIIRKDIWTRSSY
jgi:adenylosuccinate synthase